MLMLDPELPEKNKTLMFMLDLRLTGTNALKNSKIIHSNAWFPDVEQTFG
jgi:hypothetical protein